MAESEKDWFKLEDHPDFNAIKNALIDGKMPKAKIARKYNVSVATLWRYMEKKLLPAAARRRRDVDASVGDSVLKRVERLTQTAQDMVDSCAEYLADPEDPERFIIAPTAPEIQVIYWKRESDGKTRRHRASLQELIDKAADVQGDNFSIEGLHSNSPDPRKLLLEAIERTEKVLTLMAKIEGSITNVDQMSIVNSKEWTAIQTAILDATEGYPEVRSLIGTRLREISESAKRRD